MGVKTFITVNELNDIFTSYKFISLAPTTSGIIDTTYIAYTKEKSYILKKYERDIPNKINEDIKLLHELKTAGLNVPVCLDNNGTWYIYEKLHGNQPKRIKNYHIQALGKFLAKLHKQTSKTKCNSNTTIENETQEALKYTKIKYFSYYKKFEFLKKYTSKNDAIIHGDIFKDNTIFDKRKIGVIDFIDSFCGAFAYDGAVALVGFDVKLNNNYLINLFLQSYNQHTLKKLNKEVILKNMKIAANFFALKRVYTYKNTQKAKELLRT